MWHDKIFAWKNVRTVILEFKPEIEARLTALAAAQGISVEEYIQSFLESLASLDEGPSYVSMTPEQWAREFEEWLDSHDYIIAPPHTDDQISHDSKCRILRPGLL